MEQLIAKADVLLEALPYIKEFYGKRIVIKFGGSAMAEPEVVRRILEDIVFMKYVGMKPVLIHGGGPAITEKMKAQGKAPKFIDGLRVTDRQTMDIVEDVLIHTINKEIVETLCEFGANAQGLSGLDRHFIEVQKHVVYRSASSSSESSLQSALEQEQREAIDLGYVGSVTQIHPKALLQVLDKSELPVIAPIGLGPDGLSYNVNGDVVAGHIAAAIGAEKLVFLTDVEGILSDVKDQSSLISTIHESEVQEFIQKGVIAGGMIPKVTSCLESLHNGAHKGHIINGRISHSLLLEIFTNKGIGTEIIRG